ncbi:MAG: small multi-drug resistant family protein [Pseudomonadota bacterium]
MTASNITLIIVAVTMSALAQVALKYGVGRADIAPDMSLIAKSFGMLFSPYVMVGLTFYVGSVVFWLFVLRQTDLSLAYPFVGLSFVIVFFMSVFALGEPWELNRIIGAAVIVVGIIILAR